MKTLLSIITLLTITLASAKTGESPVWKTHSKGNYSISYPSTWQLDISGQMNTKFILFAPLEGTSDKFKENINLLIQDISSYGLDLDKFTALSVEQIKSMIDKSVLLEKKKLK